jgi:hypothetical protein
MFNCILRCGLVLGEDVEVDGCGGEDEWLGGGAGGSLSISTYFTTYT